MHTKKKKNAKRGKKKKRKEKNAVATFDRSKKKKCIHAHTPYTAHTHTHIKKKCTFFPSQFPSSFFLPFCTEKACFLLQFVFSYLGELRHATRVRPALDAVQNALVDERHDALLRQRVAGSHRQHHDQLSDCLCDVSAAHCFFRFLFAVAQIDHDVVHSHAQRTYDQRQHDEHLVRVEQRQTRLQALHEDGKHHRDGEQNEAYYARDVAGDHTTLLFRNRDRPGDDEHDHGDTVQDHHDDVHATKHNGLHVGLVNLREYGLHGSRSAEMTRGK